MRSHRSRPNVGLHSTLHQIKLCRQRMNVEMNVEMEVEMEVEVEVKVKVKVNKQGGGL